MMSGYELPTYSKSHNPVFATILLVIFVFIMCVVLLNCLIALMSGESAAFDSNTHVVPRTLVCLVCIWLLMQIFKDV